MTSAHTSVQQQFEAMGSAIVRLLTRAIAEPAAPASALTFRPELIVRGSTGAAPGPVPLAGPAHEGDAIERIRPVTVG